MPPVIAVGIGVAAGAGAAALGAGAVVATVVGVGSAVIAHKSGAADWVYEEVVKPVGRAVENVLTSDVGQFVLKAAAILTPGMQWAVPLIDGAATLANGGSFGDALKSAAISYVGGKVGQLGGELASQAMVKAGASEFATQVVSSAAGSGAGRASVALIMGQDPVQAFIQGGISGGLSAAAGWLETNTEGAFSKLPDAARNVITSGLSAVLTGKELTPDLVWNALLTSEGVTRTVNTFLTENTRLADKLTDNQLSALTLGIQRTAAAAFSGGDVPATILNELNRYGEQEFGKWLDDSKFGDAVNNTMDKITGDYQRAEEQAKKMDGVVQAHSTAIANYNSTVQEINAGVAEQERLQTVYERALQNFQANESADNAAALETAVDAFNDYVTDFKARYETTLKPNLDRYEQQTADLEAQFDVEAQNYDVLISDLSVSADRVADELKPVYNELDRTFVRFMNPDFNEAEYRQIAGLDADEDAYMHWLTTGKEEGLPTNAADYQAAYNDARRRAIMGAIERTGMDVADVNPAVLNNFIAYIDQNYGGDLTRLRNAPLQTLANQFSTDYTANQRQIQAIDEERADVRQIMDAWTGGQSIGVSPVITDQVNELLVAAGRPPALVGENMIQEDFDALQRYSNQLTADAKPLQATVSDFAPSTVTKEEIATGLAKRIIDPNTGLMEWSTLDLQTPFWSPELGQMVYQQSIPIFDKIDTNTAIEGYPEGIYGPAEGSKPTGEYAYIYKNLKGEWVGGVRYQPVSTFADTPVGKTLAELKDTAPAQFIEQAGVLTGDAARIIAAQVGNDVAELARNAVEYARESDSNFIKDTASVAIGGTAELAGAINDMLLLAKINPESTPLGRWARDTLALSGDVRSDAFAAASQRFSDRYNAAEGTMGALGAIWDNAWDAPGYFFAEYIAQELVQELPPALLGAMTGGTTTLALATARRMALEVSHEVGRTIAQRAALSSIVALDMAEAIGGSAGQGFDTAYMEALNAGMTEAEAIEFAYDTAISAGVTGGVIAGVSMGFLDGNAMERVIANRVTAGSVRDATNALTGKIRDGATIMVKEGVQEALEEGAVAAVIASHIVQINPDYDVAKEITINATLGAIAGVGIAGGVHTGDMLADTLLRVNPTVYNTVTSGGSNPTVTKQALEDLGITDEVVQNNLLSTISDQYHSNADVSRAFSSHPDFVVGNSDILNGVLNSVGEDVTTYVNTYVDQRYVDIAEVKAAAAAEGVTLTDEQAQAMVTQTADPEATTAALYSIQQKYDPQAVTEQEARDAFAEQGFDPTPEQLQQFTREGSESDILNALSQYVDVNQVTEEEARQYFAEIGYDPTDEEVAQFVRQQEEATVRGELEAYIDPHVVDESEVRAAFAEAGIANPAQADVDMLLGQYEEAELAGRVDEILPQARYNALVEMINNAGIDGTTDLSSVQTMIDEAVGGLNNLSAAEVGDLINKALTDPDTGIVTGTEVSALIDLALANLNNLSADDVSDIVSTAISGLDTLSEDDVKTIVDNALTGIDGLSEDDVKTIVDSALETLDVTEQITDVIGTTLGTPAVADDPTTEDVDESQPATGIFADLADLQASGLTRDEAIAQLASDLGVAQTALESAIANIDVTEQITDVIGTTLGSPAVADDPTTEDVDESQPATGIFADLEDLQASGLTRDEAIAQLATDLGVTETNLLTQLGATAQSLQEQITGVSETTQADLDFIASLIGKPARDVTQVDIDFVADLIAQQEVITDLTMAQRQYDVTGDGLINQDDFALLEQALAGTDVTFAPGSIFGPATGLYAQNQAALDAQLAAEAETQAKIDQQTQTQTQLATQLQTQLQTQDETARRRAFNDYLTQQQDLYGQRVDVKTPDPARINYFYDWQSIFATPQQSSLFPSPYAEGGQVEGTTDKLLRIIGELE